MKKMAIVAHRSIAKDVDEMLLDVLCICCHHPTSVTFEEVRKGKAIPCSNCEAWMSLCGMEEIFQGLYDMALSVDREIEASCSQSVP